MEEEAPRLVGRGALRDDDLVIDHVLALAVARVRLQTRLQHELLASQ